MDDVSDEYAESTEFQERKEDCASELKVLRQREQELIRQKSDSEAAFCQQRAKFIELFRQKEDELRKVQSMLEETSQRNAELNDKLQHEMAELDDIKTAAAVAEAVKLDEIENERRRCAEEVATLQQLMKEERTQWQREQERLHSDIAELRSRLSQDRNSFLGSFAKTLQKRIATTSASSAVSRDDQEDNEFDIKKAQEDAELLRSIVAPLEDEIKSLQDQLKQSHFEPSTVASEDSAVSSSDVHRTDKMKQLQESLQREKSSRTDLEMYVAVLMTQKNVLTEDVDKLRMQLNDVCCMLEDKKCETVSLWKLLSLLKQQMHDTRTVLSTDRMNLESCLTSDQSLQLAEIRDNHRDECEKCLKELEELIRHEELQVEAKQSTSDQTDKNVQNNDKTDAVSTEDSVVRSAPDGAAGQARCSDSHYSLTRAQRLSLTAPTRESKASDALLAVAKMQPLPAVAEQETEELNSVEALGRHCHNCCSADSRVSEVECQLKTLEQTLQNERQICDGHRKYIDELESNLNTVADDVTKQISTLAEKLHDTATCLESTKHTFASEKQQLAEELLVTTQQREEFHRRLESIQAENDILVAKHSKHALELQEELINLPSTADELQLVVLKCHEELIAEKVGHERDCEVLNSELQLLHSQTTSDERSQQQMNNEISRLREQLELEREKAELTLNSVPLSDTKSRHTVASLLQQLQKQQQINRELEMANQSLKDKLTTVTQKDSSRDWQQNRFSSLEDEVVSGRHQSWTPDNICVSCHRPFTDTLVKVECQRCLGVFCNVCTSHCINVGPAQQLSNVCAACHASAVH